MTYEEYLDSMSNPSCAECGGSESSCVCNELTGYEEHLRDSQFLGDARRCPYHPHITTSSDDGMFDGLCNLCEAGEEALRLENEPENTLTVTAVAVPPSPEEEDDIPF